MERKFYEYETEEDDYRTFECDRDYKGLPCARIIYYRMLVKRMQESPLYGHAWQHLTAVPVSEQIRAGFNEELKTLTTDELHTLLACGLGYGGLGIPDEIAEDRDALLALIDKHVDKMNEYWAKKGIQN
ncbi:MAG: hypothetical protein HUK22_01185 [Thermoguttaceae bacterium]|nr:hypothetical protein [Thermoguttaceae bacterium]